MVRLLVVIVIVISALWVYWDATGNRIGKVSGAGGFFNMSAGAWATVTMFLWIIAFPSYLIKRSTLLEVATRHPVAVKGRVIKAAILLAVGICWVLVLLAGTVQHSVR
jgi:hypothetical protein